MQRICFFDLEAKYTFDDIKPGYFSLDWNQREALRTKIIPKMGISTACVISNDKKPEICFFDEGNEDKLIKKLDSFDKIIGHNLLRFDYLVLNGITKINTIKRYKSKTVDTFAILEKATGRYIGLDNLAKCNGIKLKKTIQGREAPMLWKKGKKELVRNYCKNDVEIIKEIYKIGKNNGTINCIVPDENSADHEISVKVNW